MRDVRKLTIELSVVVVALLGCGKTQSGTPLAVRGTHDGGFGDGGDSASGASGDGLDGGVTGGVSVKRRDAGGAVGIPIGTNGRPGGGTGGRPAPATAGVGVIGSAGFVGGTGGYFTGSGGAFFGSGGSGVFMGAGGAFGGGGTGPVSQCIWGPGCMYPDGNQCNGVYCCYLQGDRCCDSAGGCGDQLPPPGDWVPPVPSSSVGDPGWKQSKEPLCTKGKSTTPASIWSDSRGVYVTAKLQAPPDDPQCPYCNMEDIRFNDGNGWTIVDGSQDYGDNQMRGVPNGPLILYGYSSLDPKMTTTTSTTSCGLAVLDNGTRTCEPVDAATGVTVANNHLAYAVLQGDIVRWDGAHWGPISVTFPGAPQLQTAWANDEVLMATSASAGKIYSLRNDTWKVEATNTLETFTAIFGMASNNIWAGTQQQHLFHYDGTNWSQVQWEGSSCSSTQAALPIISMWGTGNVLYFATQAAIGRWNGSAVETLARWTCDQNLTQVTSMWGNSENELFISVIDTRDPRQECGSQYVLYYDGSKFHRM